jgi:glutathione peroxidase
MRLDFSMPLTTLQGTQVNLADYAGKVLLIVNTASKCGFTPQYAGLEKIYQELKEKGFEILAFPCNQFGGQEPGDAGEIESFCQKNYGVSFTVFEKIEVNGSTTHPLYGQLKKAAPGLLGTEAIKWNFTKFLVNQDGEVVKRFAPQDSPDSLKAEIEALL